MKRTKITAALLCILMFTAFFCQSCKEEIAEETEVVPSVAYIGEYGTEDEILGTVEKFAEDNGYEFRKYIPSDSKDESLKDAAIQSVAEAASLVVANGHVRGSLPDEFIEGCPDILFLFDDCRSDAGLENEFDIYYSEYDIGYVAGVAAVADGFRKIGFAGGVECDSTEKYLKGFSDGIEDCAEKYGAENEIEFISEFFDSFVYSSDESDEIYTWYSDGIEIVFSCGGVSYKSVENAAATAEGKLITDDDRCESSYFTVGRCNTKAVKAALENAVLGEHNCWSNGKIKSADYIEVRKSNGEWPLFSVNETEFKSLMAELTASE